LTICQTLPDDNELPATKLLTKAAHDQADTPYGVAVDVKRAADLYAQGRTLRQIGADLGVTATT
jgi:hypothetical protein